MKLKNIIIATLALAGVLAGTAGCVINYSFSGIQIPTQAETFSVAYFNNNATFVYPTLSNTLTESLKDRFTRQTRLGQIAEGGDIALSGEITGYTEAPSAITSDGGFEGAVTNRLTITVQVRFVNVHDPQWSFENGQTFTAFADYPTSSQVTDGLVEEIVQELVDKIFNASVANW